MSSPQDGSPYAAAVALLLAAARALDGRSVAAGLDESADRYGIAATLDEVVFPAFRVIGTLWAARTLDVAHEHVLTSATTRWIHAKTEQQRPASRCRVLLAAGPSEQHTLGLDCFELLLTHLGAKVYNLGARVPADSLVLAAGQIRPDAVVVIAHNPTSSSDAISAMIKLHAAAYPTYYAGAAFEPQFARLRSPGTPLDSNLSASAGLIVRRHDQPQTSPAAAPTPTRPATITPRWDPATALTFVNPPF